MSTTDRPGGAASWEFPAAIGSGLPPWVQRAWLVERLEPAVDALAGAGLADRFALRDHPPIAVDVTWADQGQRPARVSARSWPHRSAFGRAIGPTVAGAVHDGTHPWMVELVELDGGPGGSRERPALGLPTFDGVAPTPASELVDAVLAGPEHHRAFAVDELDRALALLQQLHGSVDTFIGSTAGGVRFAMADTVGPCGWATEIYERSPRLEAFYASVLA